MVSRVPATRTKAILPPSAGPAEQAKDRRMFKFDLLGRIRKRRVGEEISRALTQITFTRLSFLSFFSARGLPHPSAEKKLSKKKERGGRGEQKNPVHLCF